MYKEICFSCSNPHKRLILLAKNSLRYHPLWFHSDPWRRLSVSSPQPCEHGLSFITPQTDRPLECLAIPTAAQKVCTEREGLGDKAQGLLQG